MTSPSARRVSVRGCRHHSRHGRTLLEVDRADEAEPLVLEALDIYGNRFEPTHPRLVSARRTAVKMYEAMDRPDRADRFREPGG